MKPLRLVNWLHKQRNQNNPDPLTPSLSVVIPCYNEHNVIPLLRKRILHSLERLGCVWEVILVDDGSDDGTLSELTALHGADPRFKVISFSRNFGHQTAVCAGLAYAAGKAVAVIDADLQDPPELLEHCIKTLSEGYDVVYGVRKARKENWLKRFAYKAFYRLLRRLSKDEIPLDSGDFCVMTRRVVDVLNSMPEQDPFVRGLRAWSGFKQIGIEYERPARAAGTTKYTCTKLIKLALDGLFSFSTLPLRSAIVAGLLAVFFGTLWAMLHIVWRIGGFRFMGHTAAELPGWTSLLCGMFLFGGLQLAVLGCIGEYVGRIFKEVKRRPRWIVEKTLGFEENIRSVQEPSGYGFEIQPFDARNQVPWPSKRSRKTIGVRKRGTSHSNLRFQNRAAAVVDSAEA